MRRLVAIGSLLFAWLCADGAVWDVAQVLAWSRMFAGYTTSLPLGDALRETFDVRKPCRLCRAIARAKTDQQKQSGAPLEQRAEKLVLICEAAATAIVAPPAVQWPATRALSVESRVDPVPVPPPRA